MAMVVQHNLQAMNANRLLGITSGQQSKSTEKLSSGYRINRAADDAAGLTISEKMRRQVRGLSQASTNAQDGVSSVQTAEGALTEVHSMLQRMNELATQAANGTQSQKDRDAIQAEIDQLSTEIDRVAETTKFNEIYLLKGDSDTKTVKMAAHDAGLKGVLTDNGNGTATFVMDELKAGDSVNIGGKNYKIVAGEEQTAAEEGKDFELEGTKAKSEIDLTNWGTGGTIDVNGKTYTQANFNTQADLVAEIKKDLGEDWTVSENGTTLTIEEAKVGGAEAVKIENADMDGGTTTPTATTADGEVTGIKTDAKLYAKDGTQELKSDELLAAYKKDGALYTTAGAGSPGQAKEVTADDFKAEGTKAKSEIDLANWGTGGTIDVNGKTYTQANFNTQADLVAEIKKDLGEDWAVSENGTTLTIEEAEVGGAEAVKIENADMDGGTTTPTAATADGEVTGVTVDKPVYAKGGTKALTDEEIKAAYDNKETLYFDKAERADNEITAAEAYELAKKELLAANQIGDTNKTAAVTNGAGGAAGKTEADYAEGDSVTINGKAYTIGASLADASKNIEDAIDQICADGTGSGTTATAAMGKIGTVSIDGTDYDIYKTQNATATDKVIFKKGAGAPNLTANQPPAADQATYFTKADILAEIKAGSSVTVTGDTADAGIAAAAIEDVNAVIADDDTDTSTVISAAKAAELENAAAAGGADAKPAGPNVFNITTASADVAKTLSFNLHVGADADMTNKIQVDIETMNSSYLGIKGLDLSDPSGIGATYAIDAIQDAISKVSAQRSTLGAIQNRLEHTIANLDNVVENTTSAESRIRDTDMASEMVEYSKNNILAQAGQAMLAQANQSTQGVLSLLG